MPAALPAPPSTLEDRSSPPDPGASEREWEDTAGDDRSQHDLLAAWFRGVARSDRAAFESLFRATREGLVRFALSIVEDEAAAADVVQDAFIRLWERREEHDPRGSVRGLLYRTVRNLSLNTVRDGRRRGRLLEERADPDAPQSPSPEESFRSRELERHLREWIAALPERQREALVLSRFEGLSHEEIAQVMDVSPRTVNNHLVRALRTLRDRATAQGLTAHPEV